MCSFLRLPLVALVSTLPYTSVGGLGEEADMPGPELGVEFEPTFTGNELWHSIRWYPSNLGV
jgi:hypothetical protein